MSDLIPTDDERAKVWLLMAYGADRVYGGNEGYADDVSSYYEYDDDVPNHKRLRAGNLVVICGKKQVLGYARIEHIVAREAVKTRHRCPTCATTKLDRRKGEPRKPWRCKNGHEFSDAERVTSEVEVIAFRAIFGGSFIAQKDPLSPTIIRPAWLKHGLQMAMRPLSLTGLIDVLPAPARKAFELAMHLDTAPYVPLADDAGSETAEPYVPTGDDLREAVQRQIKARRGQREFRERLRQRFQDKCAVTGSNVVQLLEAAHIRPYRGPQDNHVDNGLLLRTDIHTLFDLDLLGVEPLNHRIRLNPIVRVESYAAVEGEVLQCFQGQPSPDALGLRWRSFERRLQADQAS